MHQPEMVKAEFHCHTSYGKDSLIKIQDLVITCDNKGIQKLVVTDHNMISGALQAQKLDPHRFIIGEEIMTQQGELLGMFIKEKIPAGLSPLKTIEILRSQGAFISVSHPFDALRKGHWETNDLLNIVPYIDAIEVFNSRCLLPQYNMHAKSFAQRNKLLGTVGSDAHSIVEVGKSTLTLPDFDDVASLKHALTLAEAHVHLSGPWVHFLSRYASWRKRVASIIP
jgi:predicted metal-dependent phosphoesterase TrpH